MIKIFEEIKNEERYGKKVVVVVVSAAATAIVVVVKGIRVLSKGLTKTFPPSIISSSVPQHIFACVYYFLLWGKRKKNRICNRRKQMHNFVLFSLKKRCFYVNFESINIFLLLLLPFEKENIVLSILLLELINIFTMNIKREINVRCCNIEPIAEEEFWK